MQLAKVEWYGNEICENILLSTYEDVLEYQQLLVNNTNNTFHKVVTSKIPLTRWDHYGWDYKYGNSFNLAVQKCKIFGGRPIMEFDKITNEKCVSILSCIHKGQSVVINKVGGWCPVTGSIHKILEINDYIPKSDRQAVIKDNTKYINLENDPKLEGRTIEYLSALDKNYSYILRLVEYSKEELINIFKEFITKGGEIVYVYTTGSNVGQMWEYSEAIIGSGLKTVAFEFNWGYNEQHKDVVEYLTENHITVEVL